ncbi:MAG: 8-amino-7-oxononanoate synthase [Bacteroidota bacterium]
MAKVIEGMMAARLAERANLGRKRVLQAPSGQIDFCSNDYLGLAKRREPLEAVSVTGSTGSRLISGNYPLIEQAEAEISAFHQAEAGLFFSTGYAANVGLLSCLLGKGDSYISDSLVHASMIDGMRLSKAARHIFRHSNLDHLETCLQQAEGRKVVVVESLYSMDGDLAPLREINALCQRYEAGLVVDEAHATGIIGPEGRGLVCELGLENQVLVRVHTFGKAVGSHGAIILGSPTLKSYLVNFARSFVFSTAPAPGQVVQVRAAYEAVEAADEARNALQTVIAAWRKQAKRFGQPAQPSVIQHMIVPGESAVRALAATLQEAGFWVLPIVAPTVPVGSERIRICLHSYNTVAEVEALWALAGPLLRPVTSRIEIPS